MSDRSYSILVVDDDPDIREALSCFLVEEGFSVAEASQGREALHILRSQKNSFDIIILDLMMPVMNGWQFRREQQQDPFLADIPVLILSAATHGFDAAFSIGAAGYLQKPVDFTNLLSLIERMCQDKRRAAGNP